MVGIEILDASKKAGGLNALRQVSLDVAPV